MRHIGASDQYAITYVAELVRKWMPLQAAPSHNPKSAPSLRPNFETRKPYPKGLKTVNLSVCTALDEES